MAQQLHSKACQQLLTLSPTLLRLSLSVVFIWFGALKAIDSSPAHELVMQTAHQIFPFDASGFIYILGYWEILIGVLLFHTKTIKLGVILLFLQMIGAISPLFILPKICYTLVPFKLTIIGQYIIKNLVFIFAALVVIQNTTLKLTKKQN